MLLQLAIIVGEFFTEADRVGPEAAAQFRFFLQEKARRSALASSITRRFSGRCQSAPFLLLPWVPYSWALHDTFLHAGATPS